MRPRRVRLGCRRNWPPAVAPRRCFNEAEARAPRMLQPIAVERARVARASMRPRRVRLGCQRASLLAGLGSWSFNEAEARAPRMHQDVSIKQDDAKALQ